MINAVTGFDGSYSGIGIQGYYNHDPARVDDSGNGQENIADMLYLSGGVEEEANGLYTRNQILIGNGLAISEEEPDASGLTEADRTQVRELQAKDREVRQHEQTHVGMLGPYARGGPSYVYQMGPDGRAYAIGGSVKADIGKESTPGATIAKARILRMAATSVDGASSADLAVAGSAGVMESEALLATVA
ncbi:hypothetical protein DRQ25_14635 [Candidatus Fermentibacteria bacterium]|nr:MAG: hypothetical protein DRQ25_14635 [Candidatus Fermentibacteria bacterium]